MYSAATRWGTCPRSRKRRARRPRIKAQAPPRVALDRDRERLGGVGAAPDRSDERPERGRAGGVRLRGSRRVQIPACGVDAGDGGSDRRCGGEELRCCRRIGRRHPPRVVAPAYDLARVACDHRVGSV